MQNSSVATRNDIKCFAAPAIRTHTFLFFTPYFFGTRSSESRAYRRTCEYREVLPFALDSRSPILGDAHFAQARLDSEKARPDWIRVDAPWHPGSPRYRYESPATQPRLSFDPVFNCKRGIKCFAKKIVAARSCQRGTDSALRQEKAAPSESRSASVFLDRLCESDAAKCTPAR